MTEEHHPPPGGEADVPPARPVPPPPVGPGSPGPWTAPPPAPPEAPARTPAPAWSAAAGQVGSGPLNTGVPAAAPWDVDPNGPPRHIYPAQPPHPGWVPPDPAAVSGPPWPVLIADGEYTPPPLLRWPIAAGILVFAAYVVLLVSGTFSTTTRSDSRASWLAKNEATILALNRDQAALRTDNPSTGGSAAKWVADWRRLHDDAVAAASLPNPGGAATAPWREMLNNYVNGSSEVIQAVDDRDTQELNQAQRDLAAGDQAARRFNQAMGFPDRLKPDQRALNKESRASAITSSAAAVASMSRGVRASDKLPSKVTDTSSRSTAPPSVPSGRDTASPHFMATRKLPGCPTFGSRLASAMTRGGIRPTVV